VDRVKQEWQSYLEDASQERFSQRKDHKAERQQWRQLKSSYRKNFKRGYSGSVITYTLMAICITVYLLLQSDYSQEVFAQLVLYVPSGLLNLLLTMPWRLITPIFLHFSLLHIAFNLYWLYVLGGLIESKDKPWFYLCLVVCAAVFPNVFQYLISGPNFGGMSGVVYALFAYIWLSSRFNPMSGYWVRRDLVAWMLGWFVLCFTGFVGPVANFAHLGGILVGAVFAALGAVKV